MRNSRLLIAAAATMAIAGLVAEPPIRPHTPIRAPAGAKPPASVVDADSRQRKRFLQRQARKNQRRGRK